MLANNIKLALLFALLFPNFFIMSMDQSDEDNFLSVGTIIDFAQLKDDLEQDLTESLKEHKQKVLDYNKNNEIAACEFSQALIKAIINNDMTKLSNLFDGLQNIERPSLFLDLVMNMAYQERTPLLLAIECENPKIVSFLKEVAKRYFVFIDNKEMLNYAQSKVFNNKNAQEKICMLMQANSLSEKYHSLQNSFNKAFLGTSKETQGSLEVKIEAMHLENQTLEIVS